MTKETYSKPVVEIDMFKNQEDILTESFNPGGGIEGGDGGDCDELFL